MNLYFQRVDVKKPLLIKGLIIKIGGAGGHRTALSYPLISCFKSLVSYSISSSVVHSSHCLVLQSHVK